MNARPPRASTTSSAQQKVLPAVADRSTTTMRVSPNQRAAAPSSTAPARDALAQVVNEAHVLSTPASGACRQLDFDEERAAFQEGDYSLEREINNELNMEVVYVRIYVAFIKLNTVQTSKFFYRYHIRTRHLRQRLASLRRACFKRLHRW